MEREHQFTRDASHELRTPVTVIKGAVELLCKQLNPVEESALRPLDRIQRQVTNMENIIETLLWLSRENEVIDSGPPFDVSYVTHETVEQNRHFVAGKPVDIEFTAEGDPRLSIPAPVFQIALTNLIRNAIQYTEQGTVSVIVHNDRVVVSDTGRGIASDDLQAVTQPYVRGNISKGFGLGLSIVKRISDRIDWNLKIESELNRGTTVHLIFRPAGIQKS